MQYIHQTITADHGAKAQLYGYVIDFIEPTFVQFAVFNIADCAVTCGGISFVLWLAVDLFRSGDGKKGTTHDGK